MITDIISDENTSRIMRMLFKYRYKNELRLNGVKKYIEYIKSYGLVLKDRKYYTKKIAIFLIMRKLIKVEERFNHEKQFYLLALEQIKALVNKYSIEMDINTMFIKRDEIEVLKYGKELWKRI